MNKGSKTNIIAKIVSLFGAVVIGFFGGGYLFLYKLVEVSNIRGFPEGNITQAQLNWFYISLTLAVLVAISLYVLSTKLFHHKGLLALYSFYLTVFLVWFILRDFVIVPFERAQTMFLGHDISWMLQFLYRPSYTEYVYVDREIKNYMPLHMLY